jgi:hypothetical protein
MKESCSLCSGHKARVFFSWEPNLGKRDFMQCPDCGIVFVPDRFHISLADEKARYEQHNNDIWDEGYRSFLRNLIDEVLQRITPFSKGLDYGAGPGPALAQIMREEGFDVALFDPFFYPDESVLKSKYDFITCTETVEHFRNPMAEFYKLDSILKNSGWLGVMTSMLENLEEFPAWYYHRDLTHICFFNKKSFQWLAERMHWHAEFPRENVVLFQKK